MNFVLAFGTDKDLYRHLHAESRDRCFDEQVFYSRNFKAKAILHQCGFIGDCNAFVQDGNFDVSSPKYSTQSAEQQWRRMLEALRPVPGFINCISVVG